MDDLRSEQREKIEFVHGDINSQISFEAKSRGALNTQVNELAVLVKETCENMVLRYATSEEMQKVKGACEAKIGEHGKVISDLQSSMKVREQAITGLEGTANELQDSNETLKSEY